MLCQVCEKNNATIHFTKIINGNVEEKHICESCAKKNSDFDFEMPFSFQKIFTGFIDAKQKQNVKDISCNCGLTYGKFMENGKFGCASCFEVFQDDVESLLKGIHGHINHNGKVPKRASNRILQRRAIGTLRSEMEESIENEDFEKAALLRDEIKKIQEEIDKIGGEGID
ncbi:UvrB/UvrC motif-containing protein [Tissierella sp.]|uniref:UvrB/UvrC motif-containing protein n=1 Tax=Tissierella sp. TaxID=41274 RepID=UPI00285EC36D|nr:UvrB/UvrC motif-containing protein [Tissierella sp.]MDR7857808.1 UvrB/UvrC motif-containing protein [Tissierella sp.]